MDHKRKSPSERRSIAMKKKLNRDNTPAPVTRWSCHTCNDNCGKDPSICGKPYKTRRCNHCGQYMYYYVDEHGIPCLYCDDCKRLKA